MPTLSEVIKALTEVGLRRDDFNYWRRAGYLTTDFAETSPGASQEVSRDNALEIGFMAAFAAVGVTPSRARPYVERLVRGANLRSTGKTREWLIFSAGDLDHALGVDSITAKSLRVQLRGALAYTIINTGEIVRRVDELFGLAEAHS